MKNNLFLCVAIFFSLLSTSPYSHAQNGKGLVFNGKDQFVQFPATGFPTGKAARTVEFWVRAVPNTNGTSQYIFNYGKAGAKGSVFGVNGKYIKNQYHLCFWGHHQDVQSIVAIADNDWHFVAMTYDGSNLEFYFDGERKLKKALTLNTAAGPAFIGTRAGDSNHFEGSVRDIAVWNKVRNQGQIQMDMVPWPTIKGSESGLVAYVPLNEGKGNTFSDLSRKINGTLNGKAKWSKAISSNPNPIDDGIWFVIQNKSDLDADTGIPARRMALTLNNTRPVLKAIPLKGNYDAFLWRVVRKKNRNYLINKKMGINKALDTYSGKRYTHMADRGNLTGQFWIIEHANLQDWGTNVYTLTNTFLTKKEALSLEKGNEIRFVTRTASKTNQAWVLQPMELAMGYHIPTSDSKDGPMTQELDMAYNYKVYASNTVTDWAVLNGHLIWKNMLNSIYNSSAIAGLNGTTYTRKELQIISRFDQSTIVADYPLNTSNGQIIFDEDWFTKYRGGSGNDPNRNLSSTTVTQEMMCRVGVFSRGYKDNAYREFDQTVHEFGHALDHICGMNGGNFPDPSLYGSRREAIAAAIQAWYNNNNSYSNFPRTRAIQKRMNPPLHYNRLKEFFRASNSWMPPRWLRNQPSSRVALNDGETLTKGEWIYSTTPYNPNGAFAALQDDGNFVVYSNDTYKFKWGSYNNISVPLEKVKSLTMENGILRMKDAKGKNVYSSDNKPSPGARLVIENKSGSWLHIVDASGKKTLWSAKSEKQRVSSVKR